MTIAVLITQFGDERIFQVLDALRVQSLQPDRILIADGGSPHDLWMRMREQAIGPVELELHPGSVAETRASALAGIGEDIVVFLDTDELPPPEWLEHLTRPLLNQDADVVGAPTRPHGPPKSSPEKWLIHREQALYRGPARTDVVRLPMGNSAWRTTLLNRIGGFDARFIRGGEDVDVALRAAQSGARYEFVQDAWVFHDQTGMNGWKKFLIKSYHYAHGGALAYRKNGELGSRIQASAREPGPVVLRLVLFAVKALAFVASSFTWNRWKKGDA